MILSVFETKEKLEDTVSLDSLGVLANGVLELNLNCIDGAKGQSLNVEIVQASNKKTFLGGFVNTKTKLEYHHAEAQTRRKSNIRIDINHEDYVSQILQTKPESNKYQQAGYEKSVQTSRNPPRDDYPLNKIIIPSGHYVTAGEISELFVKNVIVIQRSVRKWRARKKILRAQQYKKDQMISDEDNVGVAPKNPKSLSKERAKLILEEAKQLIVIDQSKGKIRKDVHKESLVNSIIKAGKPKLWINGKGRLVKTAHEGENDERREALICLADIIGQLEQCSLTSEIIQLAEREEDLRIRGFKSHQIFGLMTRIGNLFLKLIKSPLHNPAIHQSLNNKLQLHLQPSDLSLISRELPIEYCKGCRKYLSKTSFGQAKEKKSSNKNGKQNLESKCLRCGRLDNDARTRQDLSIYKDMLNYIKKDEEHLNGFDSPVFKLKDSDIRQIVVNLWGSKSILSGLNDPYDLCLVRWDKTTHWSPWNCVLLSFEEGAIHSQLSNIKKVYKYFLIERVNYRHTLARIHFAKDPYLYSYVKNESKENKVESLSIKGDTIKPNNPNGFKF
ncbi:unnamed protein product [Lepeophtheirus salmonis]|uniref:(salmon louse) hypothetical protein n=1 Tax=Lepeophtheirus salmonis TaxID=72036 RepID=A0A7R8CHQ6_LEPSM|nr:unnamed protein product [Lepeophtheirus salmonis]CAF2826084.1 unnamed protein product [Lepeophtheirus salmonis]